MSEFPNTQPTFTDLDGNATLAANNHAARHNKVHEEVSAIAAKVGEDGSADTSTHDYKLSGVGGSDKAVSKTGAETLTNKTLTSPVINTPTGITKSDVGLGNVDNTSDATKNSATATLTNKTIEYDNNTIDNPHKFRAKRASTNQTITTGTWTTVQLNGEDFDSNSNFDTSTYKYTVPVNGFYMLVGQVYASSADGQYCIVTIQKNASSGITGGTNLAEQRLNYATSSNKVVNCATLVQLVAGDTITLVAYIDDTTTPTVLAEQTFLTGFLVSQI